MKSRKDSEMRESFKKRWLDYAAAAGAAGVGILSAAQPAKADIIVTTVNMPLGATTPIDLNHDGITDFTITDVGRFSFYLATGALAVKPGLPSNGVVSFGYGAGRIPGGFFIGPGDSFNTGRGQSILMGTWGAVYSESHGRRVKRSGTSGGSWAAFRPESGSLGLRFSIDGQDHYGWAYLSVAENHGAGGYDGTLVGYAYDTVANEGLFTTPEPGTLGLLALGSLGLGLWRRKREGVTGEKAGSPQPRI